MACYISIITGGLLRIWCFRSLRRFFTFELAVHPGHRVSHGSERDVFSPYSSLRRILSHTSFRRSSKLVHTSILPIHRIRKLMSLQKKLYPVFESHSQNVSHTIECSFSVAYSCTLPAPLCECLDCSPSFFLDSLLSRRFLILLPKRAVRASHSTARACAFHASCDPTPAESAIFDVVFRVIFRPWLAFHDVSVLILPNRRRRSDASGSFRRRI